jgi:hypothetical protein
VIARQTGFVTVTLTGSPSAVTGTPTDRFAPRSQIKHDYGLAISSAEDDLGCRLITDIFMAIVAR